MERQSDWNRQSPSFFFPIALITVGIIWLLVNNGTIPTENIYRLLPYWPVLLILGGLSILFRRLWWPVNLIMWLAAAGLLIAALLAPPAFIPRVAPVELKHQELSEPVGQAKSADATLHLSIYPARIHALDNANDLISADLYTTNTARLNVSGSDRKSLTLRTDESNFAWWRFDQIINPGSQTWDIGLAKNIPTDLQVDASTGSANLDLTGLKLSSLNIDASTGSMEVNLPEDQKISTFTLKCSTGSMRVTFPAGTSADINIHASTGSLNIDLPQDTGAQVTITDNGTGSLNLAPDFKKVQGVGGNNKEGVYENTAFTGSKSPITMRIDMSTGSVNIQ